MNSTTPSEQPAELPIPQSAWTAAGAVVEHFRESGTTIAGKGAIGPIVGATAHLIVAAELRRLADHYGEEAKRCDDGSSSDHYDGSDQWVWGQGEAYGDVADQLRARADQLDSLTT